MLSRSKPIRIKRVYDAPENEDGLRFLVDRLWPRGIRKENLQVDGWLKELAPSDALRKWFGHDPARWEEFMRRYHTELKENSKAWQSLLELTRTQTVTLLYSARDGLLNNAAALRAFLESQTRNGEG